MTTQSPFRLDGKVAAVIGASSGIGEAVAVACARAGAQVSCLDLEGGKAEAVAARLRREGLQAEAGATAIDFVKSATVQEALEDIQERHGHLDVVVATPSINVRKTILTYTDDEVDRVVTINIKGHNVLRAAACITRQRSGSIVLSLRSAPWCRAGQSVTPQQAAIVQPCARRRQVRTTCAAAVAPGWWR